MIQGVAIKRLTAHSDERGLLIEVIRADDDIFAEIKQTTYTEAYPGVIKAFHWHKRQRDIWFFARGMAQVVLHDLRDSSTTYRMTQTLFMGERNPIALSIPARVAHGYKVLGIEPALLFYHSTEVYSSEAPDEERIPYDHPAIGFDWIARPY